MTTNEIVGILRDGGLEASSTNRSAAVYVAEAMEGRATAGWFAFRIICDSDETERRARAILSRWYDIEASGDVWRLKSKNRIPLMAIKRGAAPSANGYMYLEAAQANSTVSMVSNLTTAPNLEYSTDGVTWHEWQHTTSDGTHTFDTITLGSIGDRVYLRGDNPDGLAFRQEGPGMPNFSNFVMTGAVKGGGNVMSLLDKTVQLTEVPDLGFAFLFFIMGEDVEHVLLTPPSMDTITTIGKGGCSNMYAGCTSLTAAAAMPAVTTIGEGGCSNMYADCTSLTSAAAMPAVTTIGDYGCFSMYSNCTSLTAAAAMPALTTIGDNGCDGTYGGCTFDMSDDGETLNFDFPTPPVTAGETTFSTAYDIAQWMGNTNGF